MSTPTTKPHKDDGVAGEATSGAEFLMAERGLAEDAEWKVIQRNTFTRWANEHLKKANKQLKDLETDFSDGTLLIALVEVLTGHKFQQVNKNPRFRPQKLDNVTKALKFLEENEKIRLVNIDSSDIVDGKLKLIMGLIWTFITHYSISISVYDTEPRKVEHVEAPRQRLLGWIKEKMPGFPVRNFTTDWNSGIAIGALVDACAPGLCPDWSLWTGRSPLKCATEAITAAEEWLDVPQLIRPEEMINPKVDEKAMMTYLSQFHKAKLKSGAPLRPKLDPSRVRCFGPGLEALGNVIGKPCTFTIETQAAGRGDLEVVVLNPKGIKEPCQVVANKDANLSYYCKFEPKQPGQYRVIVKYAGQEVHHSPFGVMVNVPRGDASKLSVTGPGIDKNATIRVGTRSCFTVNTKNAGPGNLECHIIDPHSKKDTIRATITQPEGRGNYLVEYTPKEAGQHQIFLYYDGQKVPGAPFVVNVGSPMNPEAAYVTGRGVQPRGIRAQDNVSFQVHTEQCGEQAPLRATLIRSDGEAEKVSVKQVDKHLWACSYVPQRPGKYTLRVLYGEADIQGSPFELVVGPYKKTAINAFGSGLHAGVVNNPNIFTVCCREQSNKIAFSIEGPSEASMNCLNNGDGSACVTYWVSQPGEYAVHVLYDGEDIQNSPYMVQILPDEGNVKSDLIRIFGTALSKSHALMVGHPAEFTVEGLKEALPRAVYQSLTDESLGNLLQVTCADDVGNPVHVNFRRNPNGSIDYSFTPKSTGVHTIYATAGNTPLKGVPFRVNVLAEPNLDEVKLWGPGLSESIQGQRCHFFIDARAAFDKNELAEGLEVYPVNVRITDDQNRAVPVDVSKRPDGTYLVEYTASTNSSAHSILPMLGNVPIVTKPVNVASRPAIDMGGIKVVEMDSKVYVSSYVKFKVDASAIDPTGTGHVTAILVDPGNERLTCQVTNNRDGTYICSYTPIEEGPHQIEVAYNDIPLHGSPYNVRIVSGCDPTRVKVYGPGLQNGPHLCPGMKAEFTVDLTGAGQGGLGLSVEGPSEAPIECHDNRDGTCTVNYTPTEPGDYTVCVHFNKTEVPGGPFYVQVCAKVDPSQVHCYGPGLESGSLRAGWPAYFTVETKKAGNARLQVNYTARPGGELRPAHIQPLGATAGKDLSQSQPYHKITYTPEAEGPCQIDVLYDGKHVPGSPFTVHIRKACEPERVRVHGKGVEGPIIASFPTTFTVDARDAGMGDLTLGLTDPKGQSIPVRVVPLAVDSESVLTNGVVPSVTSLASGDVSDTGLLLCTYEPYLAGPHIIHVMFAGVEVENSPFTIHCLPAGQAHLCKIKGEIPEFVEVNEEQVITVITHDDESARLTCQVVQPADDASGTATLLPVESVDNKDGTVSVYYKPKQLGDLAVELRFGGQLIPDGEFVQKVLTRDEFLARTKKHVPSFRPVEFRLPAPKGDFEVEAMVIQPSGVQQSVTPTINNDNTLTLVFNPTEQGMHELHVNSFLPMAAAAGSMPLQGSPYRFYVDNLATGRVTAYGPGLSHGITNIPAEFTIMAHDAGGGGLSLSVEGPSKAEITCKENGDGSCSVSYLPLTPGKYTISIKFLEQHIPGSPFVAKVTGSPASVILQGDPMKRAHLDMGAQSNISLEALADDITTLTASVVSASGREESCVLKQLPNNRLSISFTPKEVGEHMISVYQAGQHIAESPFRIFISEKELGDPRRVQVTGQGLYKGVVNKPNSFTVDTREAGYAGLSLTIEGPSKPEMECHDNGDGTCLVMYTPTEPGTYAIKVKYADADVPNSPFYATIEGDSSSQVTERITRHREASSFTTVGSRCEMSLRVADTNPQDMNAFVTSPSDQTVPCEIVPIDTDHYNIKFVPQEMGEHLVHVKHKNMPIAGSPFQFTVGPITDGVASKVRAVGPGLQQGIANAINEFNVYTREAGAGTLAIAIEGPSKADIECEEKADGSSVVSYRVSLPGTYTCSLKFNDEHVPFSPFRISVEDGQDRMASYAAGTSPTGGQSLMSSPAPSSGQVPVQLGSSVAFTIHHDENPDEVLRAVVYSPSGLIEEAVVESIGRSQYAVRFMPAESGPHFVHVHAIPASLARNHDLKLGPDSQFRSIEGSPFRLVISKETANPGMVYATGEGLRRGRVDEKNTFFVNTVKAGNGAMNVTVDGPSKVTLSTEEREEGYAFSYVPTVPGQYRISIKYGGNFHIAGSPFQATITGPGNTSATGNDEQSQIILETMDKTSAAYHGLELQDRMTGGNADLVRCEGLGLKRADMDHPNQFTIDATGAGSEVLMVGICGPTRPFEEVKVQHVTGDQYSVSYRVQERGRHLLVVKWGDRHVPGSPFVVDVP